MWPMPKLKARQSKERLAFFGPMCSGKTWCANYLVNRGEFKKVAFADKLKAIAYELYGIQGKNGKDRLLLQGLGADLRKHDPDVWIKYALSMVERIESESKRPSKIVIDDLRYNNEARALRANGFTLIQVSLPEEIRRGRISALYPETPLSSYYHPSEREWESIEPDLIVVSVDWAAALTLENYLDQGYNGDWA